MNNIAHISTEHTAHTFFYEKEKKKKKIKTRIHVDMCLNTWLVRIPSVFRQGFFYLFS